MNAEMGVEPMMPPQAEVEDLWQAAFDKVYEERFSPEALETQAAEVTSLREEADIFLSLAENVLGLEAAQVYAQAMCGHNHLHEVAEKFLPDSKNDKASADKETKTVAHDKKSCANCRAGKPCNSRRGGWLLLAA